MPIIRYVSGPCYEGCRPALPIPVGGSQLRGGRIRIPYRWWHLSVPSPELIDAEADGWIEKAGIVI
jgi:hypothetical protein